MRKGSKCFKDHLELFAVVVANDDIHVVVDKQGICVHIRNGVGLACITRGNHSSYGADSHGLRSSSDFAAHWKANSVERMFGRSALAVGSAFNSGQIVQNPGTFELERSERHSTSGACSQA